MKKNDFFEEVKITNKIYTIDEIKKLTKDIFEKYGVEKAYIFGSYARGKARKDSDIDIMIKKGKLKSLFELSGLGNDLTETLKKEIDIITEESFTEEGTHEKDIYVIKARNFFYKEILKDRVIIYDKF